MATTALTTNAPSGASHEYTDQGHVNTLVPYSADSGMRCPDPSAHQTKDLVLQNQASAAALYSTNPSKATDNRIATINPLGPDGKLSSAGAATSLKYAKAHDLPSFPVIGIDAKSSAGKAALLADQNKKSPEWWKPEQSSAAGKAALLAHDYKAAPLWQPEASAAGSKAALLAHQDNNKMTLWTPKPSSEGNSAANLAMSKPSVGTELVRASDRRDNGAFVAATGAHSLALRKRAQSNPPVIPAYPDSQNSAKNALSAATLAHNPHSRASNSTTIADSGRTHHGAMEAARIQHAKSISRDMYTSAPPVAIETEEKKRNDALRASAISMAKKMYNVQQQQIDGASAARTGATAAQSQRPTTGDADIREQAMRYIGIQEAAQKLAQERLAKIGYDESAAYRSYYGYEKTGRSKLSIRRGRNRANSASDAVQNDSDSDEDDFRSRRIRSQMEQFNKQLAEVDAKKRENDRKSLMAAAERKVQAQMQGLDKKIYDETGKMSPAMVEDWDEKARKRALANSEARMENHGKVHLGNGKWMDQSDINAVALARIQPTLDEITAKTEKRRAEDEKRRAEEEERRLDIEEKKRQAKAEKERAAEIRTLEKQAKEEEKQATKVRHAQEKLAVKQEKETERAKKAEETRLTKEAKSKSKETPTVAPATGVDQPAAQDNNDLYESPAHSSDTAAKAAPLNDTSNPTSPTSPTSPKRIKSLFNKLKRRSKHGDENDKSADEKPKGFIGGAQLRSSQKGPRTRSSSPTGHSQRATDDTHKPNIINHEDPTVSTHAEGDQYSDVSSLSDTDDPDVPFIARGRSPNHLVAAKTPGTPEFEEARDHFDEELAPPPTFTSDADKARKGSPTRDSRFKEIGI